MNTNFRTFSILNIITETRSQLEDLSLDALIIISFNGPENIHTFDAYYYAERWIYFDERLAVDDKTGKQIDDNYKTYNTLNKYDTTNLF